jgi:hypothetical protein
MVSSPKKDCEENILEFDKRYLFSQFSSLAVLLSPEVLLAEA